MALLEVKNLEVYYGVIQAIKGISFEVNKGEIVTLIGANGAGKTTTMQSIMGLIHARSGEVIYNGQKINGIPSHKIVKLGMTQVPEGRRIFSELTVYENLVMGAYTQTDKKKIKEDIDEICTRFPRLGERKKQIAGTLSGGEQQMLAMGRAMMSHPKLLMLDEPSMGLAPILVDQIFDIGGLLGGVITGILYAGLSLGSAAALNLIASNGVAVAIALLAVCVAMLLVLKLKV